MNQTRAYVFLLAGGAVFGQATGPTNFEAASVRAVPPPVGPLAPLRGGPGTSDPGRVSARNTTLRSLLDKAYGVDNDQVAGPAWLATERYDLEARVPTGATKEQYLTMLQDLLIERFHLKLHHEMRDLPVYQLVVSKNGSKWKAAGGAGGAELIQRPIGNGRVRLTATNHSLPEFAKSLASVIGTARLAGGREADANRVVDKTGLPGKYDFRIEYALGSISANDLADPGPDIFTAIQQQLGLRLDLTKLPFDRIVIDQAEKVPAEN